MIRSRFVRRRLFRHVRSASCDIANRSKVARPSPGGLLGLTAWLRPARSVPRLSSRRRPDRYRGARGDWAPSHATGPLCSWTIGYNGGSRPTVMDFTITSTGASPLHHIPTFRTRVAILVPMRPHGLSSQAVLVTQKLRPELSVSQVGTPSAQLARLRRF